VIPNDEQIEEEIQENTDSPLINAQTKQAKGKAMQLP